MEKYKRPPSVIRQSSVTNSHTEVSEVVEIPYKEIKVFDFTDADEISVDSNTINSDTDNIYFKVKNAYFRLPKDQLDKVESLVFECRKKLSGAPLQTDLFPEKYYLIRGTANYLVRFSDIEKKGSHTFFELVDSGKILKYTASYSSIIRDYSGIGLNGQQVNIVSADHCQEGTERTLFKMVPVSLTAGGKRKHKKTRRNITRRNRKSFVK